MARRGVTLLELMVVLVILAVSLAVVPAFGRPRPVRRDERAELRREAIRSGARQTRTIRIADSMIVVTAWPDGRVMPLAPQSHQQQIGR